MGTGSHNSRCENALRDGCRCTGCGGSQHGWSGAMELVKGEPAVRQRRREEHEQKLGRNSGSGLLKNNQTNRSAVADLARLDLVDWLADPTQDDTPAGTRPGSGASPTGERGDNGQIEPAEQVTIIAEAITTETWPEITRELGNVTPHAKAVRRELASHGWCDLLVGMIRVIEAVREPLKTLSGMPPLLIKTAILDSSMQHARPHVTEAVVGLVVNEVWRSFTTAAFSGVPLLELISSEEALRALQILAVFVCPAPSKHPDVRRYALKPLGEEVHHILTAQTEARLTELFAEWLPADPAAPVHPDQRPPVENGGDSHPPETPANA